MLFRALIITLVLAASFAAFHIYNARRAYSELADTAPFAEKSFPQSRNQKPVKIVEFINYDCRPCKKAHVLLLDYMAVHGDIEYVARPVPFTGNAEKAALLALATGLQGRFWDMDRALSEYDGPLDEKFFRETASLYDLDYERLQQDASGKEVYGIAQENAHAFQRAGIQKVPAFMIGKTIYQTDGDLTLNDLIRMLQDERPE